MPLRVRLVLVACLVTSLFAGACGGDGGRSESGGLPVVDVILGEGSSALRIRAEVAATPDQRALGLMNRRSLARDRGMLFIFRGPVRAAFHMKNTLIPLDIAFITAGRIRDIRSMVPCAAEPCPLTQTNASFEQALEVAAGTFERAGLTPGAPVVVRGGLPTPK